MAGVDHSSKLDRLRDLGFDEVIDYTSRDFPQQGETCDLILDMKTNRSPFHSLRVLLPTGKFGTVGGLTQRVIQLLVVGPLIRLLSGRSVQIIGSKTNQKLDYVDRLIEQGLVVPVIEGPFPLEQFGGVLHKR